MKDHINRSASHHDHPADALANDFTLLDDETLQSVAGGCCPPFTVTTNLCSCSPPGVECAA